MPEDKEVLKEADLDNQGLWPPESAWAAGSGDAGLGPGLVFCWEIHGYRFHPKWREGRREGNYVIVAKTTRILLLSVTEKQNY